MPLTVLQSTDIRAMVSMLDAIEAVRSAFLGYGAGEFSAPLYWEQADSGYVIKAVVHRPSQTMAVKTLTVDAGRRPLVSGVMTLVDRAAGEEITTDAGTITSMRTGAIVGVATDLLAPLDASRLVLLGAGGQAADQFRAVQAVRTLTSLTVVDREGSRAEMLLEALGGELTGIASDVQDDAAAAVGDADIVCCATTTVDPLFSLAALPERVHVNAVGSFRAGMRELPADLLAAATVVVDDRTAVQQESGEIIAALSSGAITSADLLELAATLREPPSPRPRTVFKTVGLAVQDWALMNAVVAARSGITTTEPRLDRPVGASSCN